jgi:hypothetical protein
MNALAGFDIEIRPLFSSERLEPLAHNERLSLFDAAYRASRDEDLPGGRSPFGRSDLGS